MKYTKKILLSLLFTGCAYAQQPFGPSDINKWNLATKNYLGNSVGLETTNRIIADSNLQYQVTSLLNTGTFFYNSDASNLVSAAYKQYQSELSGQFARTNITTASGQYVGTVMTTSKYTRVNAPVVVNAWLERIATGGAPALSIKPEIYFSYTGGTNVAEWFGDYDAPAQAIGTGTNLYTWTSAFPQFVATNTTGVYIKRSFKTTAVNNASLVVHGGSTNFPSSLSFMVPSASTLDTSNLMLKSGNTTNIIIGLTNSADYVKMTYADGILTFTEVYNGVTNTYNSLNN